LPALIISALALLFILWLLGEPYLPGRFLPPGVTS
jgi:hypothetical protein